MVEATYEAPHAAHAQMEPLNATVALQWRTSSTIWVGSQTFRWPRRGWRPPRPASSPSRSPSTTASSAAASAGAATTTKCVRPSWSPKRSASRSSCVWTREEDMTHDRYRPQAAVRLKTALGADGWPTAFDARIAVGSILRSVGMQQGGKRRRAAGGRRHRQHAIQNPECACRRHAQEHAHAGGLLALGRLVAKRLLHGKLCRRAGACRGQGRLSVPPHAAGAPPGLHRRARQDRRERRLGQTDAGRSWPRHRDPRVLRHHHRPGRGSLGQSEGRGEGASRRRRGRLRPRGQSRRSSRRRSRAASSTACRPRSMATSPSRTGAFRKTISTSTKWCGWPTRRRSRSIWRCPAARNGAASANPAPRRPRRRSPTRCSPRPARARARCRSRT